MDDLEFWAEVKANLREAYAYLLLMALTFQITEKREQWRVGHAGIF